MSYKAFVLFLLMLTVKSAVAQQADRNTEVASSRLKVYSPKDYKAHSQNFGIVQNKQGVLYFANFSGVLEYDGVFWRTIPTKKITKVSALFLDRSDRIYVGGKDEFGYLTPDNTGDLYFQSISKELTGFGAVISIFETKRGVVFVTKNKIFMWDGKKTINWEAKQPISSAFFVNNTVYLFQKDVGLSRFDDGLFTKVPLETGLANLQDVNGVLFSNGRTYIVTSDQGIYNLLNNRIQKLPSQINSYLTGKEVYSGKAVDDQNLVIFTTGGEILYVSPQNGDIKRSIQENRGLADEHINYWIEDRAGILWLALNNGIAQLDVSSPITEFGEGNDLKGQVNGVARFNGRIYCATGNGLYVMDGSLFKPLSLIRLAVWSLSESGGALFAATSKGVYRIGKDNTIAHVSSEFATSAYASKFYPGKLYVGLEDGVEEIDMARNSSIPKRMPGVTDQVEKVMEDTGGNLWIETQTNGIFRIKPDRKEIVHYNLGRGLPTLLLNQISFTSKGIIVSNAKGIYKYAPGSDRFTPFPGLLSVDTTSVWREELAEDAKGNIWTTNGDTKSIVLYEKATIGSGFVEIVKPFLPLASKTINTIYPDVNNVIWFGTNDGLIRFDLNIKRSYLQAYPAFIRRININADSVLFNGFMAADDSIGKINSKASTRIDYRFNDISFEFSAASLLPDDNLEFQYYLENFDKTWSSWTTKNQKEYTNIPPGNYRFLVKARNIYQTESKQASFAFTILPPFYQRWWAFLIYALVIAATIYIVSKKRRAFVIKKTRDLENLINERTEEVVQQKEELEQQSEQLSATNDQLERIDEFVKSINSEVNTRKLFQMVLDRLCLFQNVDNASGLIYNSAEQNYQFIALSGKIDFSLVADVKLTYDQAAQRYIDNATEVYEDIFVKNDFKNENVNSTIEDLFSARFQVSLVAPKSLITIVIRVDGQVRSFITMENLDHAHAFIQRDYNMVWNLKEHLIGAYIKTNILENLENTLTNLKSTQEQLIRQERLASVGQLTKGIVDRILNPLNYINNFSQSSGRLLEEISEVTDRTLETLNADDRDDLESGLDMLKKNLDKIYEHGNSTTRIVKDMQKLLKGKSTEFFITELNPFLESKARTAIQEVMVDYKGSEVQLSMDLYQEPVKVSLLPYEFSQVITNLISNACYTVLEKSKLVKGFEPEVKITTEHDNAWIRIVVRDNGRGIPVKEIEQLFNPFFTTKPTSKGTGLGLYMSKDIIEYHKGKMSVNSKEGQFTEIDICLPIVS